MKNFYEDTCKKSVLLILLGGLFFSHATAQQIVTYDTTFGGWNAVVTMDKALSGTDSAAGIVFFPGIGEESTDSSKIVVNGPHYLIRNGMWDGSVSLGNGVHHPFIISLQPPSASIPASVVKPKIDAILARYRIKRNSFYLTGLSMGGWYANQFVCYEATPGDDSYGRLVRALVVLEGEEPADSTGVYPSLSYPRKMGHYAKACGGRELWVEGSQDWRDMLAGAQNMCDSVPNSASYFMVTYGGGAHCCWNTEYNPSTTWTMPSNSNISQVWGTPEPMNVWQWLLRQGDTSMPAYATPVPGPPTVSAGSAQTIQLPTSSLTLTGSASGVAGATISSVAWTEISGPVTANFSAATNVTSAVSGLTTAGSYVFQLKATDNNGRSSTANVTITVNVANVPPTASAGSAQSIQLPVSSVTLSGTATGNGGATISSTAWSELSGPSTATIAAAPSLTTSVSGLSAAGIYVFQLKATDNHGLSATATVTITVTAANVPPTVSAGSAQTIQLPVSSLTLSGTATGNGGATISSTGWTEVSGPATAVIASAAALLTGVSGLTVAGTYVYQLKATDSHGLSATATVTISVEAAAPPPSAPPTVSAGSAQTIQLPVSAVTLGGTATGNDGATISNTIWTEISGPSTAAIATGGSLSTGASGLLTAGTYVFQLQATENNGLSATATVTVTVQAAAPPVNVPPTVSAGSDQSIQLPVSAVTLVGVATGNGGATISSTLWTQISGPATAAVASAASLSTGVSGLTVAGNYVFQLSATDNNGESTTDAVTISVTAAAPPPNVPPTVSAGADQSIQLPVSTVALSGVANGNGGATIASTGWTEVSGPATATTTNAAALSTGVSGLTVAGTYVFELKATDNHGLSTTAAVTITVQAAAPPPPHVPPVANAGPDQNVVMPVGQLALDGSASYDPDGTITNYSWVQLSGSGGVTISGSTQAQAGISGLRAGTYVFQLTVTDDAGATGVATVTVTVNAATVQAPVANAGADTTIALPANSVDVDGSRSTDPGGEALTYQWSELSGPTEAAMGSAGAAQSTVNGLQAGVYVFQLLVTNVSGLTDTASVQVRVVNNQRSAAAADSGSAVVMVYPNPVQSVLTVKFDDPHVSGTVLLRVFDMRGRILMTQVDQVSSSAQLLQMNLARLAKGVYALEVVIGQSKSYQKIVKQ
jgi:hypothetical protein